MSARDRVVCIGNATVDRAYALGVEAALGTKNPAVARPPAFGGVARNVAERGGTWRNGAQNVAERAERETFSAFEGAGCDLV